LLLNEELAANEAYKADVALKNAGSSII